MKILSPPPSDISGIDIVDQCLKTESQNIEDDSSFKLLRKVRKNCPLHGNSKETRQESSKKADAEPLSIMVDRDKKSSISSNKKVKFEIPESDTDLSINESLVDKVSKVLSIEDKQKERIFNFEEGTDTISETSLRLDDIESQCNMFLTANNATLANMCYPSQLARTGGVSSIIEYLTDSDAMFPPVDLSKDGYMNKKYSVIEDLENDNFIPYDPSFRKRGKMAEIKGEEICYEVHKHKQSGFITTRPLAWACAFEDYLLSSENSTHRWMYKIDAGANSKRMCYSECIITIIFGEGKMIIIHMYLRSGVVMIKGSHYKEWCFSVFPSIRSSVHEIENEMKQYLSLNQSQNSIASKDSGVSKNSSWMVSQTSSAIPSQDISRITKDRSEELETEKLPEVKLLWKQNAALSKALRHLENGFHILQALLEESDKENKNIITEFNSSIDMLEQRYDAKLKLLMEIMNSGKYRNTRDENPLVLPNEFEGMKQMINNDEDVVSISSEVERFKTLLEKKEFIYESAKGFISDEMKGVNDLISRRNVIQRKLEFSKGNSPYANDANESMTERSAEQNLLNYRNNKDHTNFANVYQLEQNIIKEQAFILNQILHLRDEMDHSNSTTISELESLESDGDDDDGDQSDEQTTYTNIDTIKVYAERFNKNPKTPSKLSNVSSNINTSGNTKGYKNKNITKNKEVCEYMGVSDMIKKKDKSESNMTKNNALIKTNSEEIHISPKCTYKTNIVVLIEPKKKIERSDCYYTVTCYI